MKKLLGEVPLEMAKWGIKPSEGHHGPVLEIATVGRAELSDEAGGRDFFFRLHKETDSVELINVLARSCYLRNRELLREACQRGDAHTLMMLRNALRESPGARARGRSNAEKRSESRLNTPMDGLHRCSSGTYTEGPSSYRRHALKFAGVEPMGTGMPRSTPQPRDLFDSLLLEADEDGNSMLHLAVRSVDVPRWGAKDKEKDKEKKEKKDKKKDKKGKKKDKKPKPVTAEDLENNGPHALKCVEILLEESTNYLGRSTAASISAAESISEGAVVAPTLNAAIVAPARRGREDRSYLLDALDVMGHTALHLAFEAVKVGEASSDALATIGKVDKEKMSLSLQADLTGGGEGGGGESEAEGEGGEGGEGGEDGEEGEGEGLGAEDGEAKGVGFGLGKGGVAIARTLVDAGARTDVTSDKGMNAFHWAMTKPEHATVLTTMLVNFLAEYARDYASGAGASAGVDAGAGAAEATEANDMLVDAEAVLNYMDAGGLTPLMTAALYGNVAATEALVSATKPDSSPFVNIWLQVRSQPP